MSINRGDFVRPNNPAATPYTESPQGMPEPEPDAVTVAARAAEQATSAADALDRLLEAARKREAGRKAELTNIQGRLSRRLGPVFAEAAVEAALDSLDKPGYPAGWGTSPRPAPTAASYKPAHGGYPGTPKMRNPEPFC